MAKAVTIPAPPMTWWQRLLLIAAANAMGVLIGGGALGFGTIVWNKANSTDQLRMSMQQTADVQAAARQEILSEIAKLQARVNNLHEGHDDRPFIGPLAPGEEPPQSIAPAEPTVLEVETAREDLQQKLDKAIYRQRQLRE